MQRESCFQNRGLKRCPRCWSWFVAEGAYSRVCTPCRIEVRATPTLPWRSLREQRKAGRDNDALAAIEAANERLK